MTTSDFDRALEELSKLHHGQSCSMKAANLDLASAVGRLLAAEPPRAMTDAERAACDVMEAAGNASLACILQTGWVSVPAGPARTLAAERHPPAPKRTLADVERDMGRACRAMPGSELWGRLQLLMNERQALLDAQQTIADEPGAGPDQA